MPLLGAHVSSAGGLYKAIGNGEAIGAQAIQVFGASPRQWAVKMPTDRDLRQFHEARAQSSVQAVYLHAAYLVNIASPDEALRARSIKNLAAHLRIAQLLESQGLIFHIGSGGQQTKEDAIGRTVEGMGQVLAAVPGEVRLIMENAAGGGAKIGAHPDEFGVIMNQLDSPRVKICLDTAHAFEAGLIEHYTPQGIAEMCDAWDKTVSADSIVALHVNDSKTPYNSRNDRHENLGQGYIGLEGFKNLAKETRLAHAAWMLEVPGFEGFGPDKENLDILKSCFA